MKNFALFSVFTGIFLLISLLSCGDRVKIESFECGEIYEYTEGNTTYRFKTVKIGSDCWMAENLNVGEEIEICPDNCCDQEDNGIIEKFCFDCDKFGGLYEWDELTDHKEIKDGEQLVRGICPKFWHIPSNEEWMDLERAIGMTEQEVVKTSNRGFEESFKLMDISDCEPSTIDDYECGSSGFNALAGEAVACIDGKQSFFIDNRAQFWTSTIDPNPNFDGPIGRFIYIGEPWIYVSTSTSSDGKAALSCRCVMDPL